MNKNRVLFVIVFVMFILLPFKVNAMSLKAYDYDGNEKTIEVESSDTIENVKQKIGMEAGKSVEDTIIVLDGKELQNGRTLNDYSVNANDIIYMLGNIYFTLNSNGGFFNDVPSEQKEYIIPEYYQDEIELQKDGYTFKGWYTKNVGGYTAGYYLNELDCQESTKFYAHWDKEETITIDLINAENVMNLADIDIDGIKYLQYKGIIIVNEETGEVKNKDGKLLFTINPLDSNITIASDLTVENNIVSIIEQTEKEELIAEGWTECPDKIELIVSTIEIYHVVFDANGGTFGNDTKIIETEDITNFNYEEFEKPTNDGYKFIGFYTKDGKSYYDVMNSEVGIEEDTTFYAKWEKIPVVTPPIPDTPKTFDNIGISIFMGIISLIVLVVATLYLKNRNKVRY